MYLVFLDSSMVYDDRTPEHEPLGGSQTALVYATRELARLGYRVRVYNRCPEPGDYGGVEYRSWNDMIANTFGPEHPDFVITLRDPVFHTFWKDRGNTGTHILWCHDWMDSPVLHFLRPDSVDHIFFVSKWQRDRMGETFGFSRDRTWIVPNGIQSDYFRTDDHVFRDEKRLVWTPTPFRGLEHMVRLMPRIVEKVPEAELHIYGGMTVYQYKDHGFDKIYDEIKGNNNIVVHGSLGQRELASELQKARVWSYTCTFTEMHCISAMEAMAAGCLPIYTDYGGLQETVGDYGIAIGEVDEPEEYGCEYEAATLIVPGHPDYDDAFVDACVQYLTDDVQWGLYARRAWAWVHNTFPWHLVVDYWVNNLDLIKRQEG